MSVAANAAVARAEAILRDRLTPAQAADFDESGWFNVRDARGFLWRIVGKLGAVVHPETDACSCNECRRRRAGPYPNLVDYRGQGRTMYPEQHGPYGGEDRLPVADEALALMLYLGDRPLAEYVHNVACPSPARSVKPNDESLRELYRSHGEARLATFPRRAVL